jgi:hypothetical protein
LDRRALQADFLVSFLALTTWRAVEQWMKAYGLGMRPRKLIEELDTSVQSGHG